MLRLTSGRALPSAVNRPLQPEADTTPSSPVLVIPTVRAKTHPLWSVPAHFRTRPSAAFDDYLLMNSLVI